MGRLAGWTSPKPAAWTAEDRFLGDLYGRVLEAHGIRPVLDTQTGVEATLRERAGRRLLFLLNHTAEEQTVKLPPGKGYRELLGDAEVEDTVTLRGHDVRILSAPA